MKFSADFTSVNKKIGPILFQTNDLFFAKNIEMGTSTNHLDKLNTSFDSKNLLEVVPYPNKEHY